MVVADDDAATRELLSELLVEAGYVVEAVRDGQEAVERIGRGGVDLLLLDVVMPRMGGIEACRVVKGMTRGEAFLPVVLLAPKTDTTSRVEGLAAGADDHVAKPLERADVLARVATMLRIKRVHDQMRAAKALLDKVSVRDELTGLHNYRYLLPRLREAFARAERQHEPLACCILDVDRLRVLNDRAGRTLGDAVLRGVAQAVRASVRERDEVVRYGADEFLLLLPATHFMGAVHVMERIWREVAERSFASPVGPCTTSVSVGVALFPSRDVRGKEDLLRAADLALGSAKRDGMNRICVFQQHGLLYTPHVGSPPPG